MYLLQFFMFSGGISFYKTKIYFIKYLLMKLPVSPIYFNPEKLVSCEYLTKKFEVFSTCFFSPFCIMSTVF